MQSGWRLPGPRGAGDLREDRAAGRGAEGTRREDGGSVDDAAAVTLEDVLAPGEEDSASLMPADGRRSWSRAPGQAPPATTAPAQLARPPMRDPRRTRNKERSHRPAPFPLLQPHTAQLAPDPPVHPLIETLNRLDAVLWAPGAEPGHV